MADVMIKKKIEIEQISEEKLSQAFTKFIWGWQNKFGSKHGHKNQPRSTKNLFSFDSNW